MSRMNEQRADEVVVCRGCQRSVALLPGELARACPYCGAKVSRDPERVQRPRHEEADR